MKMNDLALEVINGERPFRIWPVLLPIRFKKSPFALLCISCSCLDDELSFNNRGSEQKG
jgi:hypothetical protein